MIIILSKEETLRTYMLHACPRAPNHLFPRLPENLLGSQLEASTEKCFHCVLGSSVLCKEALDGVQVTTWEPDVSGLPELQRRTWGPLSWQLNTLQTQHATPLEGRWTLGTSLNRSALTQRKPSLKHWRQKHW